MRFMKKILLVFTLLSIILWSACTVDEKFHQAGFYNFKIDQSKALCKGSGILFGKCIAKKIGEGRCIGVSKYKDSHIAIEIPCNTIFPDSLQSINELTL